MIILKFNTTGQKLKRTDTSNVAAKSKNELYAEFEFDEAWQDKEPITAQFSKDNVVVDVFVEDGRCLIPWEVLQERGILSVCLIGGDLLTTNTVDISVLGTGVIGGLMPTKASPSVYSYIVELSENIEADWNNCKELLADYETTVTESQNTIADLTAKIESDFERVHTELQESKDNVDKAAKLLNDIESAMNDAISAINTEKEKAITEFNNNAAKIGDEIAALKEVIDLNYTVYPVRYIEEAYLVESENRTVSSGNHFNLMKIDSSNSSLYATNALIIANVTISHNQEKTMYMSPYRIASSVGNPANGQVIQKQNITIPAGEEVTADLIFGYINGTASGYQRIMCRLNNSNFAIQVSYKVNSITIIDLPTTDIPDVATVQRFLVNGKKCIAIPKIYDEIMELKNAIISMGGNV